MDRPGSPRNMWSRRWLIAFAAVALSACQGPSQQGPWADAGAKPPVPSWRVVERVGESRYLSPSMSGWEQVVAGSILPAGSQVSTGIGGRLILTQAFNQLSAGTSSRFILPGWEPGDRVRQTAGWMRYRIAATPASSFGIETPFLDLRMSEAVVDVTVADSETEVAVVSGRVHVKTLDDRRQIDLHAGYVGYAGVEGNPLALRRGPDLALELVPATVIPALHPGRPNDAPAVAIDPATPEESTEPHHEPARGAALGTEGVDMPSGLDARAPSLGEPMIVAAGASANVAVGRVTPVATVLPASTARPVAPSPATPLPLDDGREIPQEAAASEPGGDVEEKQQMQVARAQPIAQTAEMPISEPKDQLRRRFDLLTEGLLDGISQAPPAMPGQRR